MIDGLLQIIAPHHCYGCGEVGALLCDNCKYDIVSDGFSACLVCLMPTTDGICAAHRHGYDRAWCVGDRSGSLERLIDGFKFERARYAYKCLAELLDMTVDSLPPDTVVVAVPTIPSHIRQRGYDHAELVARHFARMRGLRYRSLLSRSSASVQRGASRRLRMAQAKQAFRCPSSLDPAVPYLVIDDVVTTNATLRYAGVALKEAGATKVWVAVVARQPLESKERTG